MVMFAVGRFKLLAKLFSLYPVIAAPDGLVKELPL